MLCSVSMIDCEHDGCAPPLLGTAGQAAFGLYRKAGYRAPGVFAAEAKRARLSC